MKEINIIKYETVECDAPLDAHGAIADLVELIVMSMDAETNHEGYVGSPGDSIENRGSLSSGLTEEEVPSFGTNNQTS